jgi:hypothetical protein
MSTVDYIITLVYNIMDIAGNTFFLDHINATNPTSSTVIPDPTKPFSIHIRNC